MQRWVLRDIKGRSAGSNSLTCSCVASGQFASFLAAGLWALRLQRPLPAPGNKEVLLGRCCLCRALQEAEFGVT